jgi:hypothetical protein
LKLLPLAQEFFSFWRKKIVNAKNEAQNEKA